jgi:2-polyprenyl-3-methyl-5-hydroxy-6-metoxy-1,4-benzoquinol methylase
MSEPLVRRLRSAVATRLDRSDRLPSAEPLRALMRRYTTEHLVGVTPGEFESRIRSFLEMRDHRMEGYADPAAQRDLSIRFTWGHDHDFGTFRLAGQMGSRHVSLLATFADRFRALDTDLSGKRVLDIGCWTGGTSLLLAAMGADVVAIEEVRKYVECVEFLRDSFGVANLDVRNLSLYDLGGGEFLQGFDVVLFAGVLYHLSDPVLGLRLTYDALRDGGTVLLETAAARSSRAVVRYRGPAAILGGSADELTRSGWNWFVPSPPVVARMMRDVGYAEVDVRPAAGSRAFAVARRRGTRDMLRAGLSRRDVP